MLKKTAGRDKKEEKGAQEPNDSDAAWIRTINNYNCIRIGRDLPGRNKVVSCRDIWHNGRLGAYTGGEEVQFDSVSRGSGGSREDGNGTDRGGGTWKDVWYSFAQTTTLHGIQTITSDSNNPFRRLFWLLLVLAGLALFCYQLTMSWIAYKQYRVDININIRYNQSLKFPAVTLCNQNTFRLTAASKLGRYKLIRDYFSNLESGGIDLDEYNATNLTIGEIYDSTYHTVDDFILGCEWDRSNNCSAKDFTMTKTDYGYCYTFNGPDRPGGPLTVTTEGMDRGLRLSLNIEQYEYMVGPNSGAGIRVLLHDQVEVPQVGNLGQAIPPGSYGYIGSEMKLMHKLVPPHGVCNSSAKAVKYQNYSVPACKTECKMIHFLRTCGCIEPHMPGSAHSCDLSTYQDCLRHATDSFHVENCSCSVPCDSSSFESSISYGSVSNFDLLRILENNRFSALKKRLTNAQEVRGKEEEALLAKDIDMINQFAKALEQLDHAIHETFHHVVHETKERIADISKERKTRSIIHLKKGLEILDFIVVNEYIRGVTVHDERTFMFVTPNHNEIAAYIKKIYPRLSDDSLPEMKRFVLFETAMSEIFKIKTAAERSIEKMAEVLSGYKNVTPIVDYKATPDKRYDDLYVTEDVLGSESDMDSLQSHGSNYIKHIGYLLNDIEAIVNLLVNAQVNATLDEDQMNIHLDKETKGLVYQAERLNYRLYRIKHFSSVTQEITQGLIGTLKQEIDYVDNIETELLVFLDDMEHNMHSADYLYVELDRISEIGNRYLIGNGTKTELVDVVLSEEIKVAFQLLETTVESMLDHVSTVSNKLPSLLTRLEGLWKVLLKGHKLQRLYGKVQEDIDTLMLDINAEDGNLKKVLAEFADVDVSFIEQNTSFLYQMMNADFANMTFEAKQEELHEVFDDLQADFSKLAKIPEAKHLYEVMEKFEQYAAEFRDSCKVDINFLRENIVQLIVYVSQLSYEEIEEEKAYTLSNFWSDIGGSIGLCIGASALTLFELLDTSVYTIFKFCLCKKVREKREEDGP